MTNAELTKLRAKAQAHDDYLLSLKMLAARRAAIRGEMRNESFLRGYEAAIMDLSGFTADAMRQRLVDSGQ